MTRVTNIGRKRSFVEASFHYNEDEPLKEPNTQPDAEPYHQPDTEPDNPVGEEEKPPKKKRKRGKRPKSGDNKSGDKAVGEEVGTNPGCPVASEAGPSVTKKSKKLNSFKDRKAASEQRRLNRIAERNYDKTCFACREMGHTVQDCPKIADGSIKAPNQGLHGNNDVGVVGICYRCGSRKHRLSQCRERVDATNSLPFASCFVCNGTGHLASACPQNKARGIYPDGGCCKLCQETDHLARNCKLRNRDVAANTMFVGTGGAAGADEDDFHLFKRHTNEVEKEQKFVEKTRKMAVVKVGVHSGKPKAFGDAPSKPKKIVTF